MLGAEDGGDTVANEEQSSYDGGRDQDVEAQRN